MLPLSLLDEPARQALSEAAAALDAAERTRHPLEMSRALQAMARSHAAMHAVASAEAYLELALRWARAAGSADHLVDLLCEACETAARLAEAHDACHPGSGHAARERARDHAFDAASRAHGVADARWELTVLLRVSDVLDRCGDRDEALELQTRALRLMHPSLPHGAPDPRLLPSLGRLADA